MRAGTKGVEKFGSELEEQSMKLRLNTEASNGSDGQGTWGGIYPTLHCQSREDTGVNPLEPPSSSTRTVPLACFGATLCCDTRIFLAIRSNNTCPP